MDAAADAVAIRPFERADTDAVLAVWRDAFLQYEDADAAAPRSAAIDRAEARDAAGTVLRRDQPRARGRHADGGFRRASRLALLVRRIERRTPVSASAAR